jgi:hypothetical protein
MAEYPLSEIQVLTGAGLICVDCMLPSTANEMHLRVSAQEAEQYCGKRFICTISEET